MINQYMGDMPSTFQAVYVKLQYQSKFYKHHGVPANLNDSSNRDLMPSSEEISEDKVQRFHKDFVVPAWVSHLKKRT